MRARLEDGTSFTAKPSASPISFPFTLMQILGYAKAVLSVVPLVSTQTGLPDSVNTLNNPCKFSGEESGGRLPERQTKPAAETCFFTSACSCLQSAAETGWPGSLIKVASPLSEIRMVHERVSAFVHVQEEFNPSICASSARSRPACP